MAIKDNPSSGSKDELLKDLKSLKSSLDEDDDNVPLLLNDDDIPVLTEDDDDIPILNAPELPDDPDATNKASLEAALRQLESMELAPKSRKTTRPANQGIEDQIRANAAPPIISNEELTRVRENPFLNSNQKAQLEANRKLREEAQQAAKANAPGQKTAAAQRPTAPMNEEIIDFTDNPFLKASTSLGHTQNNSASPTATPSPEEEDGSAEILKELGEDARPYQPRVPARAPVAEKKIAAPQKEADGFGDIILEDEEESQSHQKNISTKEVDLMVDEIVEEYMVILEAALRKKLKEKLPDLLK